MTPIDINDLTILQGKTFRQTFMWESKPIVRKPITAISLAGGSPVLSVTGHGVVNGQRVVVMGAKGMPQINCPNQTPRKSDYVEATVLDVDTVELNSVNPYDDSGRVWPAYTSGGFLQYNTLTSLAGFTARMSIKDRVGGTELFRLTTENARIVIDNVAMTILLTISATDTEALAFKKGVYDLEMVSATGVVTAISTGAITVSREVTTT